MGATTQTWAARRKSAVAAHRWSLRVREAHCSSAGASWRRTILSWPDLARAVSESARPVISYETPAAAVMTKDQPMEFLTAEGLAILDGPPNGPEDKQALPIASRERRFVIGIDGGVTGAACGGVLPEPGDVLS